MRTCGKTGVPLGNGETIPTTQWHFEPLPLTNNPVSNGTVDHWLGIVPPSASGAVAFLCGKRKG